MGTINTIKDTRVQVKFSFELVKILKDNRARIKKVPENIAQSLKSAGVNLFTKNEEESTQCLESKPAKIDLVLLHDILNKHEEGELMKKKSPLESTAKTNQVNKDSAQSLEIKINLYLSDLRWLSHILATLRAEGIVDIYLNDLLEASDLELPKNEVIERNPVLEARCQRLREEQQNREYRNMTKNVDATLKHYPEDTVAYQMKAINSQIIAVLQFIFSVAAGFVFGFLGIELIIGNLDFGLRLLLGVMIALIIALAEIYFLAKKLNEYDNTLDTANKALSNTIPAKVKLDAGEKAHED